MADAGKPTPPTDEEREAWQGWREQQSLLAKQRQLEYEQERFALAEAERLESEQRAATARYERTRQLQEQMRQQADRQMRDCQLADLHTHAIEQRQFRNAAVRSAGHAASRQRLSKALGDLMALKYPPPPPPPEPTVAVVSEDDGSADFGSRNFDPAKWAKKSRPWWR